MPSQIKFRDMGFIEQQMEIRAIGAQLVQCHRQFIANVRDQLYRAGHKYVTDATYEKFGYHDMVYAFNHDSVLLLDAEVYGPTPYGDEGNMIIRYAHNLGHFYFNKNFNIDQEVSLVQEMAYLIDYAPAEWQLKVRALYWADNMAHLMHYAVHDKFKDNQLEFLIDQLVALDV